MLLNPVIENCNAVMEKEEKIMPYGPKIICDIYKSHGVLLYSTIREIND
jgi:hypothetical protein